MAASVEDIKDILAEGSSDKSVLKSHIGELLDSLVCESTLSNPVVYKVVAAIVGLIKDGILAKFGLQIFSTVGKMFEMCDDAQVNGKPTSTGMVLDELANALFSNSCAYLQSDPALSEKFLRYILIGMLRDGSSRWSGYACVSPLLLADISMFSDHVDLLLQVMRHFPGEVLSVINELHRVQPTSFDTNIQHLIDIYDESPQAQATILHLIYEIGVRDYTIVQPYIAQLYEMSKVGDDEEARKFFQDKMRDAELKEGVIHYASPQPSPMPSPGPSPVSNDSPIVQPVQSRSIENIPKLEITENNNSHSLKGILQKRGKILGKFIPRWFVIEDGSINFFKNSKKKKPTRSLSFSEIIKVTTNDKHNPNAFVIETNKRSTILCASSSQEKEKWLEAIRSQGVKIGNE